MSGEAKVTKQVLIAELARVLESPTKEAEVVLDNILGSIVRALHAGDKVEIRGFGSFRTHQRGARVGRNPKTGAAVQVPAKRIPSFKASKELVALLNGARPDDRGM